MDEALDMRVREPGRHLCRDRPRLFVGERPAGGQAFLERPAGQVLQGHVRPPSGLPVVVDPSHVRVVECRRCASLPLETGAIGVRGEQLQGNGPLELEIAGEPDFGHRAMPKLPLEPVATAEDVAAHGDTVFGCARNC